MYHFSSYLGRVGKKATYVVLALCMVLSIGNATSVDAAVIINTHIGCSAGLSNPTLYADTTISAAGSVYLLVAVASDPAATINVADTMGGSYTLLTTSQANFVKTSVYLATLASDMDVSTDQINVNTSNYAADACALAISGLTASPVDGTAIGSNNWSTAMSTASLTPTTANTLLIGVFGWSSNVYTATPGTGWTQQKFSGTPNGVLQMESRQVASIGSYAASATLNYNDRWAGVLVALKATPTQSPTDITLSNNSVVTTDPVDTLVGTLAAVDSDTGETYTFSLVSGTGSTDNASFTIVSSELRTATPLPLGTYSIRVNVNDGTYDFAKVFTITSTPYARITGGDTSINDYITNVTFAGIDHDSGNDNGYANYTAFIGAVSPGTSPHLTATVNVGEIAFPAVVVAWIDWNHNYSFDDAGEKYVIGTNLALLGANTASATIDVPLGAALGSTRLRIASNADAGMPEPPNAGDTMFYGEAEDYTIEVSACTSTGSTAWSSSSTWTCGHVPDANELIIVSAGHTVSLSGNVTANGALALDGNLNTGANILTLGSSATVSGAGEIIGTVRRTEFSGSQPYNNAATTINFTTAPSQLDVSLTTSAHPNADAAGGGSFMLARYYTLTPTGSVDATLCLGYQQSEVGTINESNLRLCRWTGSAWNCPPRGAGSDIDTNTVCATGVTEFSDWVIGAVGPTSVVLQDLTAQSSTATSMLMLASLILVLGGGGLLIAWRGQRQI